jgi:hypothetical protein
MSQLVLEQASKQERRINMYDANYFIFQYLSRAATMLDSDELDDVYELNDPLLLLLLMLLLLLLLLSKYIWYDSAMSRLHVAHSPNEFQVCFDMVYKM